ncbi:hypothetical protein LTR85_005012 [Meristemomyces frigidus]|nr:hypothetical protein LTR85_005012 [Meristemomyces frigidus]
MCKTWNIKYACEHHFQFRLSTCRGTFTNQAKKAACRSAPTLIMRCSTPCGPCQRAEIERGFEERIAALKSQGEGSSTPPEELMKVEKDYADQDFQLRKRFPGPRFVKLTRPEKRERAMRTSGSLLKNEVQPEDVVGLWTPSSGWDDWDSTDGTYKTMQEELAELEDEKDDAIKAYEAMAAAELERWQEDVVGDGVDTSSEPGEDEEATKETTSTINCSSETEKQQPRRHDSGDSPERWLCFRSWLSVAT